ncbi:hypothetical protein AERO8C_160318 [Aeromonas veronii]|uniref:Uncharacterized protein n=1 Tax=Aeromonas veronii TaxID=654 RepID=A0A653KXL5_AERVE|nr:hypothetical protein AERO8C_160318 [Aeromonas veronii]
MSPIYVNHPFICCEHVFNINN